MQMMDVQPVKNKEQVTFSMRGKQVIKQLLAHALKFADHVASASGAAAEECEREVEQQQEVEQEMEQEVHHEKVVPRRETNWACWQEALRCSTSNGFVRVAAKTPVCSLPAWAPLYILSKQAVLE